MLKRIGVFILALSASTVMFQPTTAFAQEYDHRDRDYYAGDHWNGSRWHESRRDERREQRWREHEWREHYWRKHERAEQRYYKHHRYSPYGNYYEGYGYYSPY